jgi:phospholipid/cholesterol/gamma-HCH transport system substrate-binding protein
MKKNLFTREVKVGTMVIIAIFVLYFGLNFLKGIDIFSPVSSYYATYTNIDGLVPSSPVLIKGYKVGQVEEVKYDFSKETAFVVRISVSKDIRIPKGAKIELFDNGLMGGKAIQIVYSPLTAEQVLYEPGDTVESQIGTGLMAQVAGDLMPKIQSITEQTDSLLRSLRKVMEGKALNNSLNSIESTTDDLAQTSKQLKKLMNNDVPKIMKDVNGVTGDLKKISGNLSTVDFAATFASINHTIANLNLLTDKLNSTDGTVGLLLNDKKLYNSLNSTAEDADKLLIDLKQNPKRYVHFSLFGSKVK